MDRLRWTFQAVEDIEAICEFIAKDSSVYARLFAKDILETVTHIKDFPKSGRIVPEFSDENIREMILGNYRVIYRTNNEVIEILTIYHSARLLTNHPAPRLD